MAQQVRTHLMFEGTAEEAINFYVSLFENSEIRDVKRYEEGGNEGKVVFAGFRLNEHEFTCADSPIQHDFGFTPAISIFVDCESLEELQRVHSSLSEGGEVLMPLDNYGFSKKFAWVNDRYGVSWQLNLP